MVTQGDLVGVMELDQDDRARVFHADEQALAQHLANQMAVALKLLDQRSVQEQLFRTEKLAAVGRLISGVVNELQTPLASIADLATRAARTVHGGAGKDLAAIAAEAEKASAMVARLVSFAAAGPAEARPVSIGALLRNLVDFRERDWKASGIKVRDLLTGEPLMVMGSHGQLEQVFLRLLVHAEQSLAAAPEKVLTIRTSLLARMVVVEIVFSARGEAHNPEEVAAILSVTRGVIAGHGGEVRLIERSHADVRFEVELPLLAKERAVLVDSSANERAAPSGRPMTALVIETEETALRQILGLLAARGYRVVPVNNTDTGLDLAQRLRFDVVFCSVRAPGLNWVELAERIQSKVTGFVLMSDGYDAELAADFEADGRFVLAKPVQDSELRKVLGSIERPIPA
jgi:CheY-like chemotaxis protein